MLVVQRSMFAKIDGQSQVVLGRCVLWINRFRVGYLWGGRTVEYGVRLAFQVTNDKQSTRVIAAPWQGVVPAWLQKFSRISANFPATKSGLHRRLT